MTNEVSRIETVGDIVDILGEATARLQAAVGILHRHGDRTIDEQPKFDFERVIAKEAIENDAARSATCRKTCEGVRQF